MTFKLQEVANFGMFFHVIGSMDPYVFSPLVLLYSVLVL